MKVTLNDVLHSVYTTIITNIPKSLGKGLGWIINSVIHHTISISNYNTSAGNNYIEITEKKIDHPRKGFINIQNTEDNECFNWCLVIYLNPADHHPARITKADKDFAKMLDFKDINFPVKKKNTLTYYWLEKEKKHVLKGFDWTFQIWFVTFPNEKLLAKLILNVARYG